MRLCHTKGSGQIRESHSVATAGMTPLNLPQQHHSPYEPFIYHLSLSSGSLVYGRKGW